MSDHITPAKMIAYTRVSTHEQGESGLGLDAQKAGIQWECSRRHWPQVTEWYEEVANADPGRPVLAQALDRVQAPDVDGLMVYRLDRIGRSVVDLANYIECAVKQGWLLVILNPSVDMTDPYGRAFAQMGAVFAELERELIRQRTSEALQAKLARGERIGPEPTVGADVEARVAELRANGLGSKRIADTLTAEGFSTPSGGPWHRQTVERIFRRLVWRAETQGRAA